MFFQYVVFTYFNLRGCELDMLEVWSTEDREDFEEY